MPVPISTTDGRLFADGLVVMTYLAPPVMMGASCVNIATAKRLMGNAACRRCPTIAKTNVPTPRTPGKAGANAPARRW